MKRKAGLAVALSCIALLAAASAQAANYTLDFTFQDFFIPGGGGNPSPEDSISGKIVYAAESLTSEVSSILSVGLAINGHTYSVDDLAWGRRYFGDGQFWIYYFGGALSGASAAQWGTDDFNLSWKATPDSVRFDGFFYTTAGIDDCWYAGSADMMITQNTSPVPIPSAMLLLGSGLAGLAGIGRIRMKRK